MSTIKDLRNKQENNLNLVDGIKLLVPSGKPKYISMILSLIKKSIDIDSEVRRIKSNMVRTFNIDEGEIDKLEPLQILLLDRAVFSMFEDGALGRIKKFCDYNERGLIQKNDLTSYTSFVEVMNQVSISELKEIEKELEAQIFKLYEYNEWLIIKPCTASEHDQSYFNDYSRRGILIYCINRKTNYKVACYRQLNESSVSFWTETDLRIDSFQTELPEHILSLIKHEVLNNTVSNESLIPMEFKKERLMKSLSLKKSPRFVNDEVASPLSAAGDMEMTQEEGRMLGEEIRQRIRRNPHLPLLDDIRGLDDIGELEQEANTLMEIGLHNGEVLREALSEEDLS